jgi:hypothetical protein
MKRVAPPLVALTALLVIGCSSATPVPSASPTLTQTTTITPQWQASIGGQLSGQPPYLVRLILTYQPYQSAPPTNDITFVAVCSGCAGSPSPVIGRLVLTPEQCGGAASQAQPPPNGRTCWSAPVTFPSAGTWHFTTPYDVDLKIP